LSASVSEFESYRMKSARAQTIFSLSVGSLLLCFTAFYNGYPLIYPDTGAYLWSGFRGEVPIDRPLLYGLFVRHMSLSTSLWFVVVAQGILIGSAVFLFVKHLLPRSRYHVWYLILTTVLVLCTGISVRNSQIMPDIFAALPALSLSVLLFGQGVSRGARWYLGLLTVVGLVMHSSHPPIYVGTLLLLSLAWALRWWRTRELPIRARDGALAWGLVILAWLTIPTVHVLFGGPFQSNQGSHIFFMGQLNGMGLLQPYLKKHCDPENPYFLCEYQGQIPMDYLWDSNSPLYKTGGWAEQDPEVYARLSSDILTDPGYFKLFLIKVIFGTFHQFFHFHTGNTPEQRSQSSGYQAIQNYFPYEIYPLVFARQWIEDRLDHTALNRRERVLIFACLLVVALLMLQPGWVKRIPPSLLWSLTLIMVMLVVNAAICGGLSSGNMRYQNRVVWLLPLVLGLIALSQRGRWYAWWQRLSQRARV
jgi:hypothetical protein